MMQCQRSVLVAIIVLSVCCSMLQGEALAESSFHAGGRHLRKGLMVASGTGLPRFNLHDHQSVVASKPKSTLMEAINSFRAEVCTKLKGLHGEAFNSFTACKKFMAEQCGSEKTKADEKPGYCKDYFKEQEAEKELEDLEGKEAADEDIKKLERSTEPEEVVQGAPPAVKTSPPPSPAPETQVAAPPAAAAEEKSPAIPAATPAAAAPASAATSPPGLSPTPAPKFIPGKSVGKPNGVNEDESWYFKNGGKWDGRLHMDGSLKLPSQGYWGKLVEHEDKMSVTGDWGTEFGPASKHRSSSVICKDFPHNAWCKHQRLIHHKHHDKHLDKHSSAYSGSTPWIGLVTLFLVWVMN